MLPFNFGHIASGPIMTLMHYHRLRHDGVRPAWMIVEVLPPALCGEQPQLVRDGMTLGDYPVLCRYLNPPYLTYRYVQSRLRRGTATATGLSSEWHRSGWLPRTARATRGASRMRGAAFAFMKPRTARRRRSGGHWNGPTISTARHSRLRRSSRR